jgi:hypothetical protein
MCSLRLNQRFPKTRECRHEDGNARRHRSVSGRQQEEILLGDNLMRDERSVSRGSTGAPGRAMKTDPLERVTTPASPRDKPRDRHR